MALAINSVTPSQVLSVGEDCVTIIGTDFAPPSSGQFSRVFFGGIPALSGGAIDATTIIALVPPGLLGAADVTVEIVTPGTPDVVTDSITLVAGVTYQRPSIQTNRDQSASGDSVLTVVTRELISELRRTVIANAHHDMHPEYVDVTSEAEGQEVQSEAPNLKLVGPTVTEDRFYSTNGAFDELVVLPDFNVFHQPVTVRLDYQYVGVGRTKGEAFNIWNALTLFLNRKIFLEVARDGLDKTNGTISFELNPTWEERGEFSTTSRQGFHQFAGALHLRGVHATARPICPGKEVDVTVLTTEIIL